MNEQRLQEFEDYLDYQFKNVNLLKEALCHSSYRNEHVEATMDNERLEFLGDAVLQLAMSELLFKKKEESTEGDLSRIRSNLVNEDTMAEVARSIDLGDFIFLGKGEEKSGGRDRSSNLCDAMEAVLGAVFLDSNYECTKELIYRMFQNMDQNYIIETAADADPKLELQILAQQDFKKKVQYWTTKIGGTDNDPIFHAKVIIDAEARGEGYGSSKKKAEMMAAIAALKTLKG